jgi:SAM-dependent methyltransferase
VLQIEARNSQRNQNRLKLVRGLKPEGRMLEIGCGKGQFLQMAAAYYTAEGVDISQHAIDSLKANTSFSVRRMDVELEDLPALTYDIIIAFNILEHLQDPGRVIRKIYAALKPGGYLVGSVPYNAALTGRTHTLLTNLFDITHCSTFPPQQWRGLFAGGRLSRDLLLRRSDGWEKYQRLSASPLVVVVCVQPDVPGAKEKINRGGCDANERSCERFSGSKSAGCGGRFAQSEQIWQRNLQRFKGAWFPRLRGEPANDRGSR